MASELRPLVKQLSLRRSASPDGERVYQGQVGKSPVTATMTGIGTAAGARAARRVLDAAEVDHLVVVGIAGGLGDRLAIGDVVVPSVVIDGATGAGYRPHPLGAQPNDGGLHTSDDLLLDDDTLAALAMQGVVALDMETAAIAAVCEERGCPWSVIRSISDRTSDGMVDDAVASLARPDGSADLPAVARFVVRHPNRIGQLTRLGRDMKTATNAAAAAAVRALRELDAERGAA
jgi:adenosylhomocysteine nucleosidase